MLTINFNYRWPWTISLRLIIYIHTWSLLIFCSRQEYNAALLFRRRTRRSCLLFRPTPFGDDTMGTCPNVAGTTDVGLSIKTYPSPSGTSYARLSTILYNPCCPGIYSNVSLESPRSRCFSVLIDVAKHTNSNAQRTSLYYETRCSRAVS